MSLLEHSGVTSKSWFSVLHARPCLLHAGKTDGQTKPRLDAKVPQKLHTALTIGSVHAGHSRKDQLETVNCIQEAWIWIVVPLEPWKRVGHGTGKECWAAENRAKWNNLWCENWRMGWLLRKETASLKRQKAWSNWWQTWNVPGK